MIHMSDYVYDLEIDVKKLFPEIPLLSIYEFQQWYQLSLIHNIHMIYISLESYTTGFFCMKIRYIMLTV